MKLVHIFLLTLLAVIKINADSNADLINSKVERTIDLTTNVVHILNVITIENKATSGSLKSYTFVVEPNQIDNVACVSAYLNSPKGNTGEDSEKRRLNVAVLTNDPKKGLLYRIDFQNDLLAGKNVVIDVEVILVNSLRPYPTEITQSEKQYALYKGNHYYYSLYQTRTQTTLVNLASDKTESFSQLKPTTKSDSTITYGPYENVKPFEQNDLTIHYENNSPFLTITNLIRTIEISHWGNIAVEETVDMYHSGAKLKGSFSRFDYMRRQGGSSSVKSFKTLLPPSASDVYYRDEIGNISTSNLRIPKNSKVNEPVELELRPRFPLFGGWKTHYTIGYNVPVYQYLFTKGDDFLLRMKLIDHIYDDQYIESATIRIILPEHSTNTEIQIPYPVEGLKNDVHYTYLDTIGRPVVVIHRKNSVDSHIRDFNLKYKFQKYLIFKEPLLIVGFFYILFTAVIIISRIDFSIPTNQNETHAKKE